MSFRFLWLAVVLGLAALGCSSDPATSAEPDRSSAVYEYVGLPYYGDLAFLESFDAAGEHQLVEEATATCMEEAGFEHTIIEFPETPEPLDVDEGLDRGSREFAERFGYGISTQRFPPEDVGPDLVGVAQIEPQPDPINPNSQYLQTLSDQRQAEYFFAFLGDFNTEPPVLGCWPAAREQYSTLHATTTFFNDFEADLEQINADVEADPRIAPLFVDFDTCMDEAGPFEDIAESTWKLADLEERLEDQGEFTADDLDVLQELQTNEIRTAVAAIDCGGEPIDTDLYGEVTTEYEEQFVEDNRDRLDAFIASRP